MKVQIKAFYRDERYIPYDDVQDWDMCNTVFEVYKAALGEFGRCISRMYIDVKNGKSKHVGWVFEKKYYYEDTHESYIQETWIIPLKSYEIKHIYEYAIEG